MEGQLNVQVISHDIVKPSCPTPLDRKTLTLSFLDESFPTIHVPTLLIYTGNESTMTTLNNITRLNRSLSETLTQFYPLAGRFENEYTVSCNDEGIPFLATSVNCKLIDYLNSPQKYEFLSMFHPPEDLLSFGQLPIYEVVPLAFQINYFTCGGVALGCYSIHKLIDAFSLSIFLNYWAAHASGQHGDLVKPDFDTIIRTFPPLSKDKRVKINAIISDGDANNDYDAATAPASVGLWEHLNVPIKVVQKSFKFDNTAVKNLKFGGISETVPNPTSFEVVAGFVWKHAMDAISNINNNNIELAQPIPNVLSFGASLRSRTNPPLSKQSMGNIITEVFARVHYGDGSCSDQTLKETIREIHATIQTLNQKARTLQDENGVQAFLAESASKFKDSVKEKYKSSMFTVVSWYNIGISNVDFGFGRPIKIIPLAIIYPFQKNSIRMVEYSDTHGHGIEVFVCLEDKHMTSLENSSQFMALATSS